MGALERIRLDAALRDVLSPAVRQRLMDYDRKVEELREQRGPVFADLWTRAQRWLAHPGRVAPPPRRWDFLPAMQGGRVGESYGFGADEREQWLAFWQWYLPVESALLNLCEVIRGLDVEEERGLLREVCLKAFAILGQYQQWLRDGTLAWLPTSRGVQGTIVERLDRCLVRHDPGPA